MGRWSVAAVGAITTLSLGAVGHDGTLSMGRAFEARQFVESAGTRDHTRGSRRGVEMSKGSLWVEKEGIKECIGAMKFRS